jgi:hypothetical protein
MPSNRSEQNGTAHQFAVLGRRPFRGRIHGQLDFAGNGNN